MFVKFFNFLRGYVFLKVKGFFVERFLNLCSKKDICLWDIKYCDENNLDMKMSIKGFKMVRNAAYKTRSKVKIHKKVGLPFIINKYKKRKAFLAGILIAVFLFFYLSSFIWRVEVSGNSRVSTQKIIETLKECGFKNGNLRYGVDVYNLQNEMMKKIDDLSWFWLEIKGTKATVKVKERVVAPEIIDNTTPSNVVASVGGLITQVVATLGESVVKEGDVVDKGDLLISGVVDLNEYGYKYVNAQGEVRARTWYTKDGEFPLFKTEYKLSEKKVSKRAVNFFGYDVLLYMNNKIPFKYYDTEKKDKQLGFGKNFYLPVTYKKNIYYEKNKIVTKLTTDDALVYYGDRLRNELSKSLDKGVTVVNKTVEHKMLNNGNIYIKVTYECTQNICKNIKLENGG